MQLISIVLLHNSAGRTIFIQSRDMQLCAWMPMPWFASRILVETLAHARTKLAGPSRSVKTSESFRRPLCCCTFRWTPPFIARRAFVAYALSIARAGRAGRGTAGTPGCPFGVGLGTLVARHVSALLRLQLHASTVSSAAALQACSETQVRKYQEIGCTTKPIRGVSRCHDS